MAKDKYSREEIIQALKELDAESDRPIGASALKRKGISSYWVSKLIPEGLTKLKRRHGIRLSAQEQPRSDDELLRIYDKVVSELEHIPSWTQFRHHTKMAESTLIRRFGKEGKAGLIKRYRKWLKEHNPKSKNIGLVDIYLKALDESRSVSSRSAVKKAGTARTGKWPKGPGREYGPLLNFGSLVYQPTNEQGVVLLFGMVSQKLGFSIEYVGTDFPDCEAKRYIDGRQNRQQSVKIEFEYKSRDYDHPIDGCDVIVCWDDNWGKDCPLEVIELRSEIEALRALPEFKHK